MAEAVGAALAVPGLHWLALTMLAAGAVRGFAGFGTALVFMPVAGLFLPPAEAVTVMAVAGVLSAVLLVPRALPLADRREVMVLAGAAVIAAPLGLWALTRVDPVVLRWVVAGAAALTLAALVAGWRYPGRVGPAGLAGVGASAGVLGGMTGLTGPPVILFYLAGPGTAAVVRANTILFLAVLDGALLGQMLGAGIVDAPGLVLGGLLALPYACGMAVGVRLFRPGAEAVYRRVALLVIGGAILAGLPLWG
jgi:uncharacterized membrane protein YfcA